MLLVMPFVVPLLVPSQGNPQKRKVSVIPSATLVTRGFVSLGSAPPAFPAVASVGSPPWVEVVAPTAPARVVARWVVGVPPLLAVRPPFVRKVGADQVWAPPPGVPPPRFETPVGSLPPGGLATRKTEQARGMVARKRAVPLAGAVDACVGPQEAARAASPRVAAPEVATE